MTKLLISVLDERRDPSFGSHGNSYGSSAVVTLADEQSSKVFVHYLFSYKTYVDS